MTEYTLYELNSYIKRVVALNFSDEVWVRFEISQIQSSRGHFYLECVEKNAGDHAIIARTQAVIWRSTYTNLVAEHGALLNELLQDGVKVNALVKVEYHEKYGLKLQLKDIDPSYTIGEIELKRQQIIEDLTEQGLLDLNASVPLPEAFRNLAIISSETAAGLEDFQVQLRDNVYGYTFKQTLYPCSMQGDRVEVEMLAQLKKVYQNSHDCIIIIRGGGSKIDLSAFDSFLLGEMLAEAPYPVFTGIGHERDNNVLDIVAHSSFKTPTALGHFIVEHNADFERNLMNISRRIQENVRRQIEVDKYKLNEIFYKLSHLSIARLTQESNQIDIIKSNILSESKIILLKEDQKIETLATKIEGLNPVHVLERGYSITFKSGKKIKSSSGLTTGDEIMTYFHDGAVSSEVK